MRSVEKSLREMESAFSEDPDAIEHDESRDEGVFVEPWANDRDGLGRRLLSISH